MSHWTATYSSAPRVTMALLAIVRPVATCSTFARGASVDDTVTERTGEPREAPTGWDLGWEAAMAEWISTENLEERMTARGWIDPRVLAYLRDKSA